MEEVTLEKGRDPSEGAGKGGRARKNSIAGRGHVRHAAPEAGCRSLARVGTSRLSSASPVSLTSGRGAGETWKPSLRVGKDAWGALPQMQPWLRDSSPPCSQMHRFPVYRDASYTSAHLGLIATVKGDVIIPTSPRGTSSGGGLETLPSRH